MTNRIPRSFKVKLSAFNGKKSERYRPGEHKKINLFLYIKKLTIFVTISKSNLLKNEKTKYGSETFYTVL